MIRVIHVFDETAGWQHRVAAGQLLDRLPRDSYPAELAAIDTGTQQELNQLPMRPRQVPRIADVNLLAAPLVRRMCEERNIDLVHTWGPSAAAVAASGTQRPLIIELFDPDVAVQGAKILRSIFRPEKFAVICSTQWIRRKLIENGVPPEACVVIRPGIDFALIQKVRKSHLRAELGIGQDDFVIVLPPVGPRDEAALDAFWAGAVLNHLDGHYKVIAPGTGLQVEKIERFASSLPTAATLVSPSESVPFEHLVSIADALVMPGEASADTTAVAWAFGAGAVVIAAATYAVTELVVTKVNGLLYKHPHGKSAVSRIAALLRDREAQRKAKEAARGQAYEVFSLRRFVDQHVQVYENVLADRPPSEGITDPAQIEGGA